MRSTSVLVTLALGGLLLPGPVSAERPVQKRDRADYVLSGPVTAVYARDTKGYWQFIVEIRIEKVYKGSGLKKGDTFRAFCYQRKKGFGGLQYDTPGTSWFRRRASRSKSSSTASAGATRGSTRTGWMSCRKQRSERGAS
jgi:hypothetical protein